MADSEPKTEHLIALAAQGDRGAESQLIGRLGPELHQLAVQYLRGKRASGTLQPTALVHEAWLKFGRREGLSFPNRTAFLAFASRVMRNLLVDRAREQRASKRAGGAQRVSLNENLAGGRTEQFELLDVDDALQRLEQEDPESARVVELRFYGGLNNVEIAEHLDWPLRRVERRWQFARAWLLKVLA